MRFSWKRKRVVFVRCAALLAAVYFVAPYIPILQPSALARRLGGHYVFTVLRSPDSVRVAVIDRGPPEKHRQWIEKMRSTKQVPLLCELVELSHDDAQRLSRILTTPESYLDPGIAKGCIPNPGVLLRFTKWGQVVDVMVCFECDILFTFHGDASFDPTHELLLEIVKRTIPLNSEIQALK